MGIPPITPVAYSVPFDNANNNAYPASDDSVQNALESVAVRMYSAANTVANATLVLTQNSPYVQFFSGTVTGQIIQLPNATTLKANAFRYEFWNVSTQPIAIKNNGGTVIFTLYPNIKTWAMLQDNSTTNGVWIFSATQIGINSTNAIDDYHAGYEWILAAETKDVPFRKQMIIHGLCQIDGLLTVEGTFVLIG